MPFLIGSCFVSIPELLSDNQAHPHWQKSIANFERRVHKCTIQEY